jgi:hypothetical protein
MSSLPSSILARVCIIALVRAARSSSHLPPIYEPNNVWCEVQTVALLCVQFVLLHITSSILDLNIPISTPFSDPPQSVSFAYCDRPSFVPIRNISAVVVLCTLIFTKGRIQKYEKLWSLVKIGNDSCNGHSADNPALFVIKASDTLQFLSLTP